MKTRTIDTALESLRFSIKFTCINWPINYEIKHALSCLLQNNLRGGEMLFKTEKPRRKPRFLYFKQHFDIFLM